MAVAGQPSDGALRPRLRSYAGVKPLAHLSSALLPGLRRHQVRKMSRALMKEMMHLLTAALRAADTRMLVRGEPIWDCG